MKKHLLLVFAVLLPLLASAHDFEVEGVYYNIVPGTKQAEVTYQGNRFDEYNDEYFGSITIPSAVTYDGVEYSVTSIGEYAFLACYNLTSVTLSEGMASIGREAFWDCTNLVSINIPESVTSIASEAFWNCRSLSSITIPKNVANIGRVAFHYCCGLTSITIAEDSQLSSIEEGTFSMCSSVKNITIPGSVTSIGVGAFYECSNLASINIPEGVTSIEDYTFHGCCSLTSINMPVDIKSIGRYAFSYCDSLTNITLPKSTTSIGEYAFHSCSSLASIVIPESITEIGGNAFIGCISLARITVNCANVVGHWFRNGDEITPSSIKEIILGSGVKSIADGAFTCGSLTSITSQAITPPIIEYATFDGVNKSIPVYVPAGTAKAYKAAPYWCEFNIIDITGIESPEFNTQNSEIIYDLRGHRVETPTKPGIYIVNENKVVVK